MRATNGTVTNGFAAFTGSVALQTSADNNRLAAQFNFSDGGNNYNLNFGGTSGFNAGRSSFINDALFAARESVDSNVNSTSQFNGATSPFTKLFMVSAATVPIDFQTFAGPGVTACTCSFMQWGWWIGEVQDPNGVRQRFNLATWVAGVLPNLGDMPTVGTATYSGHAIGNVSASGVGNYVAAGNFQQNWNFATKSGTAIISNFDRGGALGAGGVNVSGGVTAPNGRDFSGSSVTGGPITTGSVSGSFFRSPSDAAAGVGGNFSLSNGGTYKAAGTFAAQR
jgi:hypothetical protein